MTKEEIVEYVMHTPQNSNPRVLADMLEQLSTASGSTGGDQYCTVLELTENDYTIVNDLDNPEGGDL